MNALQVFTYTDHPVRVIDVNGAPFFVGKDVAAILGYRDTSDALKKHVDEEDKGVGDLPTPGGLQKVITINESGLYSLILRSQLPTARHFKHWVTSEVLPSIRKHGAYLTPTTMEKVLADPDFEITLLQELKAERHMLILDELSSFKNPQAKRFKALLKVRPKVRRIVGLTGTPSSNGLMDLWAEYRLLDLGERLGKFIGGYRNTYFRPDKTNGIIVYSYKPLPGAEERIYSRIADMTISMRCTDLLQMPELISVPYEVTMSEEEKDVYTRLKQDLVLSLPDGEVTASNAAALSGKLSQMSNGAVYNDDGGVVTIHSRKLDALEDLIEAANGKPVLVAYWFKHDYDRITDRLRSIGIRYAKIDTEESISRWNRKTIPVGLIHPASAGHGLNLQAGGSTLIWFGLTWSLELYIQTNARLWRQGQVSSTVVIQHIITKGTVDERILKALQQKEVTQDALMDAVKAQLGGAS